VLITRAGVLATLMAGAMALTACSDNSKNTSSSTPTASNTASSTTSAGKDASCGSGELKAEGSTAQGNAIDQWIKDYQQKCTGATVNYNGTGSGAGVKQFIGKQVDFAGSDSALKADKGEVANAAKACGSPAVDLPMVIGPIAVAYNLKGVDAVTLTPSLIAKIFLGKITKWDDAALKAANPSASLPSTAISVFFRSDESGTTENFEKYLAKAASADFPIEPSKSWGGKVGSGKAKSSGVQEGVQSVEGGIGYMEYSYADNAGLGVAKVDNGGGAVELNADSAAKAVAAATIVDASGKDLALKLDYATKVAGAYPIVLVTYEIACTKYADVAKGSAVKAFLNYIANAGQAGLADLGYAPLPTEIQSKVVAAIAAIS